MEALVTVVLPVSLAIIMLSLGIGLTLADFRRVAERPRAFFLGASCQVLVVPLIAYVTILAFGLSGEIAAGVILLSLCPGGVTSNIVSKFAKGDVALSVSLTAVVSLLSIVTVPVALAWAVVHFMGADAPDVSVTEIAIQMALITAVPVLLGMLIRAASARLADRVEPVLGLLASLLFAAVVIAAVASLWDLFIQNVSTLGPALIVMNVVLMGLALLLAGWAGLTWLERKTISVEVGIQNGTLGINVAPLVMTASAGIPVLAMPSAVYGVTMYLVALPFVLFMRTR